MKCSDYILKFVFCSLSFLNCLVFSNAQELRIKTKKVPSIVLEAFKTKYPDIKVRQWKKTKDNLYKANYAKREIIFSADGKWIETRTALAIIEMPLEIKSNIVKTEYNSWQIHDIVKSETIDNPVVLIIEVKKGNDFFGEGKYEAFMKVRELYYSPNGNFVKMVDLTPDNNFW